MRLKTTDLTRFLAQRTPTESARLLKVMELEFVLKKLFLFLKELKAETTSQRPYVTLNHMLEQALGSNYVGRWTDRTLFQLQLLVVNVFQVELESRFTDLTKDAQRTLPVLVCFGLFPFRLGRRHFFVTIFLFSLSLVDSFFGFLGSKDKFIKILNLACFDL